MKFLKNKITSVLILILIITVSIFAYLFGKPYFQRKSFENERDKNRTDRCMSREKSNCNSNRKVCTLYDKKSNKECQNEFDECVKNSVLKCEDDT